MKKIAVPSDDETSIAAHFGRSACFMVFETEGGRIVQKEVRMNGLGGAAHGECHGSGSHNQPHGHNHALLGEILQDCSVVLCRGMGMHAAEALKAVGIEPVVVQTQLSAQEAVEAYLAGSLRAGAGFCRCQH